MFLLLLTENHTTFWLTLSLAVFTTWSDSAKKIHLNNFLSLKSPSVQQILLGSPQKCRKVIFRQKRVYTIYTSQEEKEDKDKSNQAFRLVSVLLIRPTLFKFSFVFISSRYLIILCCISFVFLSILFLCINVSLET